MALIERDEELAALESCRDTDGRVVIIEGCVASGKTALLHEFAERAAAAGTRLLRATGSRTERSLQFGVVQQLFTQIRTSPDNDSDISWLQKDGRLSKLLPVLDGPERVAGRTLDALWMELLRLSERSPLIIIVDDIHYADDSSADCLLYFARRLRWAPIIMILANCTQQRQPIPLFQAELTRQPHCLSIHLQMLSQDGVGRLLAEHLDVPDAGHLAAAVYRATGGNPLLVHALADDYRDTAPSPSGELVVGEAFSRAVQICLDRFDPAMLRLARALAILPMPAPPELLAQFLDLPAEAVAGLLAELRRVRLVRDGQFRHPAIRAAALSVMLPEEHASMHGRAAQILHHENAPAKDIARHLLAAASADETWAVGVLEEAAGQATAEGEVSLALRCLQFARRLSRSEHEYAAITSKIAEADWRVDPAAAIRHVPDLIQAVRQGTLRGRDAAKAVLYLLWSGRPDDAIGTLEYATSGRPDAFCEPELLAMRLWIPHLYPALSARITSPDGKAPPLLASPQLQIARMLAEMAAGKATEAAERIPQITALDDGTLALVVTAMSVSGYCEPSGAIALWSQTFLDDTYLDRSAARVPPTWQGLLTEIRADINVRTGNLPAAEQQAREAITSISPRSWGVAIGAPVGLLVLAATARGNLGGAADYLSIPVPETMFLSLFGPLYLNARGRYYLATERFQLALRDFEACGDLVARWDVDRPEFIPWRLGAAEAYLGLGEPRQARDLVEEQPIPFGSRRTRAYGMSLRVLAAASPLRDRAHLLREAIDVLRKCGDRIETARAFADLSRACHALNEPLEARGMRRRAEQLAKQCGAAAFYPGEAGTGGGPAEAAGTGTQLSDAERRVATLAARGFTNREIANRLYVTVSTVEQHLTRAYRKLNVNRRSDLPTWLRVDITDSEPISDEGA
jgi:DNA-binding CsgD family transcriptional regulator